MSVLFLFLFLFFFGLCFVSGRLIDLRVNQQALNKVFLEVPEKPCTYILNYQEIT